METENRRQTWKNWENTSLCGNKESSDSDIVETKGKPIVSSVEQSPKDPSKTKPEGKLRSKERGKT
jgi:hypothetical protein